MKDMMMKQYFNSIKVRLERFVFITALINFLYFNSIKVRLEQGEGC